MKKKRSWVGSLLCFAPHVSDDDEENEERSHHDDSPEIESGRRKGSRRFIRKIVKSLSMKSRSSNRDLKSRRDSSRSLLRRDSELSVNQSASETGGRNWEDANSLSPAMSSSSSSESLLSVPSCPCCAALRRTRSKRTVMPLSALGNPRYAIALFLLLLSLFVVVFCGRLCAILWTATWLCLVPRRGIRKIPPEFADGVEAAEAAEARRAAEHREEEKKRVVMEGFLQRSRKLV